MTCIQCSSVVNENEQYYVADDMDSQIISVIEQSLGHQVDEKGVICSQCFDILMHRMSSVNALADDSNVCVMCMKSLFERRSVSIPEGVETEYIAKTIAPREIPKGGLLCLGCWLYTRRTIKELGIISSAVDTNVCVWCQRSLGKVRSHSIPEGPERITIVAAIHPREIPPEGLVCYACWVAARRNVERARRIGSKHHTPGRQKRHQNSLCTWCRKSLRKRPRHVATGQVRDEVTAGIYPIEMSQKSGGQQCRGGPRQIQDGRVLQFPLPAHL